jgi:hypothetical protein
MDDLSFSTWPFLIPIVAIIGVFATAIVVTLARARVRELEIRERIAMIEKGLVPPPEVDPRGFDTAMDRYERIRRVRGQNRRSPRRHRSAGVTLMGVGFGLMVLIAFAGESPSSAVGVGGFLVVIGLAFFLNSLFDHHLTEPIAGSPEPGRTAGPIVSASEPKRHD